MRQRHKPWADTFLRENKHLVIPQAQQYKSKWKELFGNDNPVHVEIGTGKGQFLVGMAQQHPDINFIGIELAKSIVVTAAQKVLDAQHKNVLLLNENAADFRGIFADGEIDCIYLNFSDPWPKNRHAKRRLTYQSFLVQYQEVLANTGEVIFKTDNRGLFEYSLVSFSQFGMLLNEVNLDLHAIEDPLNVMTEYEEKFSAKGQPIYRCRAFFPGN